MLDAQDRLVISLAAQKQPANTATQKEPARHTVERLAG
jgi:hypothetical protein